MDEHEPKVSPWLRLWSISLAMGLATLGAIAVFGLFLHGSFLDSLVARSMDYLRTRPGLQAALACSPLVAAVLLGYGSSKKRKRRLEAERIAEARKEAGLD